MEDNIQNQNLVEATETKDDTLNFGYSSVTEETKSIIKVVGVGGGGSNAVATMFRTGIKDVSFLIINTDKPALESSTIPHKLLISEDGLGAGAQPERAEKYASEHEEAIRSALNDGTKMAFITAGMGGGTGTGASPVVARIAHELGILTIGIVTIPFSFEGMPKIQMALAGVRKIRQYVDALLVVNNNRLVDVYPDLDFFNAFRKADDTLTMAAKSISDIINITGYINLDFADVEKTLKNSGVALISTGDAEGEGRVSKAIEEAINSPLLQDNDISKAKRLLFELCFSEEHPVSMAEIGELNKFVERFRGGNIDVIWGALVDNTLDNKVRMIVLASGFEVKGADDETLDPKNIIKPGLTETRQPEVQKEDEKDTAIETPVVNTEAATEPAVEPVPVKESEPVEAPIEAATIGTDEEPKVAAVPVVTPEVGNMPQEEPMVASIPVQPASDIDDGLKQISIYYGQEMANSYALDQIRKRYYILDTKDLNNESLISKLEQMPSYNRTAEQVEELKRASQQGNKTVQNNNQSLF